VCDAISDELLEHVRELGSHVAARLRRVRGAGLLLAVETDRPAGDIVAACLERGVLVGTAGDSALRLTPPLVLSDLELDRGLQILEEVFHS
jgi:acetylornithine/N-succinyldiaminopimelate aminotransferase